MVGAALEPAFIGKPDYWAAEITTLCHCLPTLKGPDDPTR